MNIPTDIKSAYEFTLQQCEALAASGIKMTTRPSRSAKSKEMCAKVIGRDDRLQPESWVYVEFELDNIIEMAMIESSEEKLREHGIIFDTSGMFPCWAWEIDWSFGLAPANHKYHRDAVERRKVARGLL